MIGRFFLVVSLIPLLSLRAHSAGHESFSVSGGTETPVGKELSLKLNLIYGAASSVSLAAEYPLSGRWSADLSFSYNPWEHSDGLRWKHWLVQPETRYWTKEMMKGHFIGAHVLGGVYNLNRIHLPFRAKPVTASSNFEGWGAGAGLVYGYRWNFTERWGMEGSLGLGYIFSRYDRYYSTRCGEKQASGNYNYFGPTKLALNLIYRFGKGRRSRATQPSCYSTAALMRRDTVTVRDTVMIRDTIVIDKTPVTRSLSRTETVRFAVGRSSTDFDSAGTTALLSSIDSLMSSAGTKIEHIIIKGYCSIEGSIAMNERLSIERAEVLSHMISERYPSLKNCIVSEGYGEDWDGLLRLVNDSRAEYHSSISCIVSDIDIRNGREAEVMKLNGGVPYKDMKKRFFHLLRRAECIILYSVTDPE